MHAEAEPYLFIKLPEKTPQAALFHGTGNEQACRCQDQKKSYFKAQRRHQLQLFAKGKGWIGRTPRIQRDTVGKKQKTADNKQKIFLEHIPSSLHHSNSIIEIFLIFHVYPALKMDSLSRCLKLHMQYSVF